MGATLADGPSRPRRPAFGRGQLGLVSGIAAYTSAAPDSPASARLGHTMCAPVASATQPAITELIAAATHTASPARQGTPPARTVPNGSFQAKLDFIEK